MIIWLKEGESSYEVGRRLNCPHSKPLYWQKRYQEEGIAGLVTKQRSGRPLQIPDDKEASIHEQLEDKNLAVGIVVGSIFIGLGIAIGLVIGMGLN